MEHVKKQGHLTLLFPVSPLVSHFPKVKRENLKSMEKLANLEKNTILAPFFSTSPMISKFSKMKRENLGILEKKNTIYPLFFP